MVMMRDQVPREASHEFFMSKKRCRAMIKGNAQAAVMTIPQITHATSDPVTRPAAPSSIRWLGMSWSTASRLHVHAAMRATNTSRTENMGRTDSPPKQAATVNDNPQAVKKANPSIIAISDIPSLWSKTWLMPLDEENFGRAVDPVEHLLQLVMGAILAFGLFWVVATLESAEARKGARASLPVEQNATCGISALAVVYTRHQIWVDCFMRLGGMESPRPGQLNVQKVTKFRSDHLYFWERLLTPSAQEIIDRCDQPPLDGWVTQAEFEQTTNRLCLADADAICHARDVCERETRHLGRDEIV